MPDRQSDTTMKILDLVDKAMSILLAVDLNFWIQKAERKAVDTDHPRRVGRG